MRRSFGWVVLVAGLLQACGGLDGLEQQGDALVGDACQDGEINWPPSSTTDVCSGPWQYENACCITSHVGDDCKHVHTVGSYSEPRTVAGEFTCTRERCYYDCGYGPTPVEGKSKNLPPANCGKECVCVGGYWTYPECGTNSTTAGSVKQGVVIAYAGCRIDPALNPSDLSTWVTVTGAVPSGTGGSSATCTFTVRNSPNGQRKVCDYESDLALCGPDTAQPIYGACVPGRTTNPPPDGTAHVEVDPIGKAACAALGEGHSTNGLTRQELLDANPKVVSSYRYLAAACLSCEDVGGLANAAGVQQKLQCLRRQIETPAAGAPAYDTVAIDHLKRLFEAYGHSLAQEQVDFAVSLYETRPEVQPQCGSYWAAPEEATPTPELTLLRSDLQMCHRLLDPHAASQSDPEAKSGPLPRLDWLMTPKCVDTVDQAKVAAAGNPNQRAYLDEALALSVPIAKVGFRYLGDASFGETRSASLSRNLAQLGHWYGHAKQGAYAEPEADAKLTGDTSALAGGLWDGLYTSDIAALRLRSSDGSLYDYELTEHLNLGLRKDIELLGALFPPAGSAPPLTGAPALYLVADGLEMLSERLELYAPYHDLGCRFLGCRTRKTEVSALHSLLSSVADTSALDTALGSAATVPGRASTWNEWRSVLARMSARHADVFRPAVLDSLPPGYFGTDPPQYSPGLVLAPPAGSAEPLEALAAFVTGARSRLDNYGQTGLFLDGSGDALSYPLRFEDWGSIVGRLESALALLDHAIGDYDSGRAGLAGALIDEIDLQQAQASIESRMLILAEQVDRLGTTMAELRLGGSIDASLFAQEALRFEQAMRDLQDANTPLFPVSDRYLPPISGQAQYTGPAPFVHLSEVAVPDGASGLLKESGGRGDVINFQVTGAYSPTCAMKGLGGKFAGLDLTGVDGAMTGPEGFELVYSTGTFQAHSFSASTQHRWSSSVKACAGFKLGPIVPKVLSFGASVEACAGYDYSYSRTTEDKNGWENRSSAGFSKGLRLPTTPFPNYPVGALLAVQVGAGQDPTRAAIRGVQVVQRQGAVALNEDADVYLVVNDLACPTTGALDVRITKLTRPLAGSASRNLVEAMSGVVSELEAQWSSIIAAGRILPDQMGGIRIRAWDALRASVEQGWQLSSYYPEIVTGFFDAWLSYQIVKTERAVDLVALNEDYRLKLMELNSLVADLEALDRKGRLLRLVPTWTLANLDGSALRSRAEFVMYLASQEAYPFVHVRVPEALTGWPDGTPGLLASPGSLLALVDGTPTNNWSSPIDDLGVLVRNAVNAVLQYGTNAAGDGVHPGKANRTVTQVVVRFPNPDASRAFPPAATDGHTVDPLRAQAAWDAIVSGNPVRVEIRPEDVYAQGNAEARLSCWDAAPVVLGMALYFESNGCSTPGDENGCTDENWNALPKRAESFGASGMYFPTSAGVESLRFVDRAWLNGLQNKALWGPEGYAVSYFEGARNQVYAQGVKGISPFTTFDFSPMLGTLYPTASGIDPYALVVVLELESVHKADPVWGVDTCP